MITLKFELTGPGWAMATIFEGSRVATIEASYFTDALGDLARAVIALLEGAKRAECWWVREPGEDNWLLSQHEDTISIRIVDFKDWEMFRRPKDRGKMVLKARGSLRDFAKSLLQEMDRLYRTLGPGGYKKAWIRHEFPLGEYRKLQSLLEPTA